MVIYHLSFILILILIFVLVFKWFASDKLCVKRMCM